ncbi:Z1 domain-containing protein [Bifidobacterium miconisargentati]|uniref:Z1 domain-containing protein n=1 Tax=Bifidobacterium miconisargentati TaxID=2834437 RepID=UPI001BDBEA46|nr:Z1 domain-containing protein [Bifidobacterium miconisargentati]MBW3090058.1 Z1 domain-containing protein [Bifidobacterium miconisargentati]
MTSIKDLSDWIYENVARELGRIQDRETSSTPITEEMIKDNFRNWFNVAAIVRPEFKDICASVPNDYIDKLVQEYEERESYFKPVGFGYQDENTQPWLNERKPSIDWFYWDRYRKYLRERKHWSESTIRSMNEDTDNILDRIADPKSESSFDRRGLVIASVQSGKTANYIGLISKAADAGYKVIIVMAGIYNVLRNQTQERIEDGFIGYDLVERKRVGVGIGCSNSRRPLLGTSRNRDFNKVTEDTMRGVTSGHIREPLVFVIKKNANSLREISLWLETNCKDDGPLLLIDDEADNASINVSYDKGEISKINGQIRGILQLFSQSAYVGYTATPFANVLIDSTSHDDKKGDDIFPRSFIYTLEQSDAYFGAEKVFGDKDNGFPEYLRWITDDDESQGIKRRSGDVLTGLPESLEEAVRAFIVACSLRVLSRDADEHMSMMINMSPYKSVQHSVYYLVSEYVDQYKNAINSFSSLPEKQALASSRLLRELKLTWEKQYPQEEFTWGDVQHSLADTVKPLHIVEINSQSNDTLDYGHMAQRVIAIGGYRLSRGLTLEGLLVSYYARNAKAYDSLMQMARWFGYRFGYEHLCRIWMTRQSADWYAYVATATKDLTDQVRSMCNAHSTPDQYGLRVRTDPDTLMITARNKMGAGERFKSEKVSLDGAFIETIAFNRDEKTCRLNTKAAEELLDELEAHGYQAIAPEYGKGLLYRNVPSGTVRQFIREYHNCSRSPKSEPASIIRHISRLDEYGHDSWDIYIASGEAGSSGEFHLSDTDPNKQVSLRRERRSPSPDTTDLVFMVKNGRLASRGVEKVTLNKDQVRQAEDRFHEQHKDESSKKNVSDIYYRQVPGRKPLLIIHPVMLQFKDEKDYQQNWLENTAIRNHDIWPSYDYAEEAIGWSISFPEVGIPAETYYTYNDVMIRHMGLTPDIENEEQDDDATPDD